MKTIGISPFSICCVLAITASGITSAQINAGNSQLPAIEQTIINNDSSYYYIDFKHYPVNDASLPIGVFDSGTGGLTILDAIVKFDEYNNTSRRKGSDNSPDFKNEQFIYLADQANMPYGNYYSENKTDLLIENVLKDAQFLMSDRYYKHNSDQDFATDKQPVKAIVIACNTATAYGREEVEKFIDRTGIKLKIIGVIDAGAKGTLSVFKKDESGSVGVLATVGTIASKGYENAISGLKTRLHFTGNLQIFSQAGHGVAESVDGEPDFIRPDISVPRKDYRGPSLNSLEFRIDKALLDIYGFDFTGNKMICDNSNTDDCQIMQLNSAGNYMRYHLVSLMEKIRRSPKAPPLKVIVLGCTHYPFLLNDIRNTLKHLYNYKKDGQFIYRPFMSDDIKIIDPAVNVASELYSYLKNNDLFNSDGDQAGSEFYISVPNLSNPDVQTDSAGRFTYRYKYGRMAGTLQQYVKVVPFMESNISPQTINRLKEIMPQTYELINAFLNKNPKTSHIHATEKIINQPNGN